jgi:outer membrane protein TolC
MLRTPFVGCWKLRAFYRLCTGKTGGKRLAALWSAFLAGSTALAQVAPQPPTPAEPSTNRTSLDLKLSEYVRLVLDRNEQVQAQVLDAESSRHKARAEYGVFEPDLVLSAKRERTKRVNNNQQQSEQNGLIYFDEVNYLYDSGLEMLAPTGAKVRLGYSLSDLSNNLTNAYSIFSFGGGLRQEFQSIVGVTVTQPLLKNAGTGVTMAGIRLAALESDIAFQQYRRQLMLAVSQAEAAYWNLYFAQQQLRFFEESLGVAESVLSDTQERLKAGHASELEVLEAQSGLAMRRTKQNEARQNFFEAIGRIQTLYAVSPTHGGPAVRAVDIPPMPKPEFVYGQRFQSAFQLNPDYLMQQKKVDQERVRLKVARNQLLPELNAVGSYGYSGVGRSQGASLDMLETTSWPAWSAGFELRIPLEFNIKGRHLFTATQLSLQSAIVSLNSVETQIANSLNTSISKARGWYGSVENYQTVVRFNEDLLKTQMARLSVGKIEPRKVLEVEADLFDARQSLSEAQVHYQRTLLEMEMADGTLLTSRSLDLTRDELRLRTKHLRKDAGYLSGPFAPIAREAETTQSK